MKLKSYEYCENAGDHSEWYLDKFCLNEINLIVGRNATGKSRTLNSINFIAQCISGLKNESIAPFRAFFEFENGGDLYEYLVVFDGVSYSEERFTYNNKELISRKGNGEGWIYSEKLKENLDFEIDNDQLAITAKKDRVQHPFLNPVHEWADTVKFYRFANSEHQKVAMKHGADGEIDENFEPTTNHAVALWFSAGCKSCSNFSRKIRDDMKKIGYNLSDIGVGFPDGVSFAGSGPLKVLYVKEKGLQATVWQHAMSQGMFRTLAVVIEINYLIESNKYGCVLIDDVGEGLDFERSSSLIDLMISRFEAGGRQIIMTTNDRFVMNNIPLEYWHVMERSGNRVKVYNKTNAREKFEEFSFTGLANFDFLKSGFYR